MSAPSAEHIHTHPPLAPALLGGKRAFIPSEDGDCSPKILSFTQVFFHLFTCCCFLLSSLCVRQVASSKWLIFDLINTRVSARFTIAP